MLTLTRSTGKHQEALKLVLNSAPISSKNQAVKVMSKCYMKPQICANNRKFSDLVLLSVCLFFFLLSFEKFF